MYGDTISDEIEKVDFSVYVCYGLIVQSVDCFRSAFQASIFINEKVKIIMCCFIEIYHGFYF